MRERLNVLIFPIGTENGLEIWKSLRCAKGIRVYGATNHSINHSPFVLSKPQLVLDVHQSGWVDSINRIIDELEIDYVYPANSIVIDALVSERDKIHCKLALPDSDIVRQTRSKKLTLQLLDGKIPMPICYDRSTDVFPVFAKPNSGYGSQGVQIIESREELDLFLRRESDEDYLLQEYLPGKEYTVDCLSDSRGILFCAGRTRERIRMGTSMHSELAGDELQRPFKKYATAIHDVFKIEGAWFFQLREDHDGVPKLLEIDIRIAGTMALNRVRGINFPLLSLLIFEKAPIGILESNYNVIIDRSLQNRYLSNVEYDTVFVDLDDTIVNPSGHVNLEVVRFLYQCVNANKTIILVSKNLRFLRRRYLKKLRIDRLFDRVIWLKEKASKAEVIRKIRYGKGIFIDDSFSQRREVFDKTGMPTFDPSMIEMLLDDRI